MAACARGHIDERDLTAKCDGSAVDGIRFKRNDGDHRLYPKEQEAGSKLGCARRRRADERRRDKACVG